MPNTILVFPLLPPSSHIAFAFSEAANKAAAAEYYDDGDDNHVFAQT